jgi:heme oxygenase
MKPLSRTLIQLNLATRKHHAMADGLWLGLMVPSVRKSDYLRQLVTVYGFEAPLEAALRYTPGLNALVDLRAHGRTGLLVQDLMRLGVGPGRIAGLAQRFTTFSSSAEALGWMYVVERATLLHGGARRFLTARLPELTTASSYLSAYDGVTGDRWSDLGGALDAVAATPAGKRQLLRAADQGYEALAEWFCVRPAVESVGA